MKSKRHSLAACCSALLLTSGAGAAHAASCESLGGLSLPDITITAAQSIPAGTSAASGGVVGLMPKSFSMKERLSAGALTAASALCVIGARGGALATWAGAATRAGIRSAGRGTGRGTGAV